jgi:hypothetical protein
MALGITWNLDLALAAGLRDMGGTAGPDHHTLDRGRDGGNCVASSKEAVTLLLPSRYCCRRDCRVFYVVLTIVTPGEAGPPPP